MPIFGKHLATSLAVVSAIALASPALAQGQPIKVGFVTPLSGGGTADSQALMNGIQLYLNIIHSQMGGRTVQMIYENDQDSASTADAKVNDLINHKGINVLSGIYPNDILRAVESSVQSHQMPFVAILPEPGERPAYGGIGIPAYAELEPPSHEPGDFLCSYSPALSSQGNRHFIQAYTARYGTPPNAYAEAGFTLMLWLDHAVNMVRGNVENKTAFAGALHSVKLIDAPRGPMQINAAGQITENLYRVRIQKINGVDRQVVIQTTPGMP